jgi:hypothetical protein
MKLIAMRFGFAVEAAQGWAAGALGRYKQN